MNKKFVFLFSLVLILKVWIISSVALAFDDKMRRAKWNSGRYRNTAHSKPHLSIGGGVHYGRSNNYHISSSIQHAVRSTPFGYEIGCKYSQDFYYNIAGEIKTKNYDHYMFSKNMIITDIGLYYTLRDQFEDNINRSLKNVGLAFDMGFTGGLSINYQWMRKNSGNIKKYTGTNPSDQYINDLATSGFFFTFHLGTTIKMFIKDKFFFFIQGDLEFMPLKKINQSPPNLSNSPEYPSVNPSGSIAAFLISNKAGNRNRIWPMNRKVTPFVSSGIGLKL